MKNREIKFRAWDKEHKEMIYKHDEIPLFYEEDSGFHSGYILGNTHRRAGDWVELWLMQWTGLKNIYEGDIVKVHQFLFDGNEIEKEWIGEVVYIIEHNCCGFGLKVISGDFALHHTGYKSFEDLPPIALSSIYGLHEESFKVIGNIYENPELLENKVKQESK